MQMQHLPGFVIGNFVDSLLRAMLVALSLCAVCALLPLIAVTCTRERGKTGVNLLSISLVTTRLTERERETEKRNDSANPCVQQRPRCQPVNRRQIDKLTAPLSLP